MAWTTPTSGDAFWDLTEDWVTALTEIRTAIRDREDIQSRAHGTLTLPSSGAEIRSVTYAFIVAARADIEAMLEEAADSRHEFIWTDASWVTTTVPSWSSLAVLRSSAASMTLITELQDILDDMKYYTVDYYTLEDDMVYPSGSSTRTSNEDGASEGFNHSNAENIWDDTKTGTPGPDGGGTDSDPTDDGLGDVLRVAWSMGNAGSVGVVGHSDNGGRIRGPKIEITLDTSDLAGVLTDAVTGRATESRRLDDAVNYKLTAAGASSVNDTWSDSDASTTITYNSGHDPDFLGTDLVLTLEITTAEPADHPFDAFTNDVQGAWTYSNVGVSLFVRVNATSVLTN